MSYLKAERDGMNSYKVKSDLKGQDLYEAYVSITASIIDGSPNPDMALTFINSAVADAVKLADEVRLKKGLAQVKTPTSGFAIN